MNNVFMTISYGAVCLKIYYLSLGPQEMRPWIITSSTKVKTEARIRRRDDETVPSPGYMSS